MTFQRSLAKIALLFVMAVPAHAQTPPSFGAGYRVALLQINRGGLTRLGFMNNLAKIWAALPRSSGKSYHDGWVAKQASPRWAQYDREMKRIYPS